MADTRKSSNFDDLSILVVSCDKYSELWDNFFQLLFKNWPELKLNEKNIPIYLISNNKKFSNSRVQPIQIPHEISWSDNVIKALETIKTKYVLILLEDYYITHLDLNRLSDLYGYMKKSNAAYIQIYGDFLPGEDRKALNVYDGVSIKQPHEKWRTSLQPCVWRTRELKHMLKSGESAWAFEIEGSVRSEGCLTDFLVAHDQVPIEFLNMSYNGYIVSKHLNTLKDQGIYFEPKTLKIDSDNKLKFWFQLRFKPYMYWEVYKPLKEFVKKIL